MRILLPILVLGLMPLAASGQDAEESGASRGREFFLTYKCYACHGYTGETGSPRLVPMSRSEASFLAFLRSPSGTMPAYTDVPEDRLTDIYAYIRSVEPDAPPVEEIPLLEEVLEEVRSRDP